MTPQARLARKRKILEHQWPWVVLTLLGVAGLGALLLALRLGLFSEVSDYLSSTLRGYTLFGTLLGVASVGLLLFDAFYSLRKRSLQEALPLGRATMLSWLWA